MTSERTPVRIQRKRTKGWKMPEGAVSVCRPGYWGNPFVVAHHVGPGKQVGGSYIAVPTAEDAVECYRLFLHEPAQAERLARVKELRGKLLACFCEPEAACHADVLLELANAEPAP